MHEDGIQMGMHGSNNNGACGVVGRFVDGDDDTRPAEE